MTKSKLIIECCDLNQISIAKKKMLDNPNSDVVFDLTKFKFFLPENIAHIRCLIDLSKNINSLSQKTILPPENSSAKDYAGRIGLFDSTSYQYPYDKHEAVKFFPLYKINSDSNDPLIDQFVTVFSNTNIPINYCRDIAETFSEIADNVYFHSGASYKTGSGYACAQIVNHILHIAVCDLGIGFYNSYKNNGTLKGRNEQQILRDSVEELVSSLNDPFRGIGLFQAREFIERHGNCLEISTGNYRLVVSKQNIVVQKLDIPFDGAIIKMEIPTV